MPPELVESSEYSNSCIDIVNLPSTIDPSVVYCIVVPSIVIPVIVSSVNSKDDQKLNQLVFFLLTRMSIYISFLFLLIVTAFFMNCASELVIPKSNDVVSSNVVS